MIAQHNDMAEDERRQVAFLGPEASYTHQAAIDAFKHESVTLAPQITIADVFTAVQNGTAYRGVVPFENSSNGSVVFTLDLIADLHGIHPDIQVCGESYVAVKHCLLGFAPDPNSLSQEDAIGSSKRDIKIDESFAPVTTPTAPLSKITKLYSHPQAWGQCKAFLSTYLKGIERQDVSSTSRAAELVAQDKSGESAALSSVVAAEVFGLDVLAESINDRVGNTTRFLVIKKRDTTETTTSSSTPAPASSPTDTPYKTLLTFTVDHANPGALAHCLAAFEKYSLNLTSINTRPSGIENWNYIFFVELKGRKEEGDELGKVNCALGELRSVARGLRWLGSWESRE